MKIYVVHITCIILYLFSSAVYGQAILIDYDYLNPTATRWRYESGRDTTFHSERLIRVGREMPVKIRLQNINADALQPELIVRRGINSDSLVISSLLGLVGNFAAPAGLDLKGMMALKSRGAAPATILYAPLQVDLEAARAFANSSVAELDVSIRERLTEISRWRTVREQVRSLRYHPSLPKAELLRRCRESLVQLAATAPDLFDNPTQAQSLLGQLALENAEYLRYALTLMEQKATSTTATRGDVTQADFNQFMVAEAIKQHRKVVTDDLADQLTTVLNETLAHYQALMRNTFTTSLSTTIDRGSEAIILQFAETNPPPASTDKRKLVRTDKFIISPPGQWQLSTSLGLSFIQFSQRLLSYGVLDGKVVASDQDQFIPSLAAYVQAFPRTSAYVRLGAHVGVGVPLTDARGVCFQVGPSLLIGRQNALSINAGLFTSRATRLGAGLSVGDKYTSTVGLPTVNRYEWGYQVGLSFQFGLRR